MLRVTWLRGVVAAAMMAVLVWASGMQEGKAATKKEGNTATKKKRPRAANVTAYYALLKWHDAFRKENKLAGFKVDEKLTKCAQDYADYMAKHGKYGHNLDGRVMDRAKRAGYVFRRVGENIAKTRFHTALDVMNGWKKSPGHRKAILTKVYEHIGIGIAKGKKKIYYWVVVFGQPRKSTSDKK